MSEQISVKHVLIVDDIEQNLYLLRMMLSHAGCIVHEASNGHEALVVLEKQDIELIISDILMPEMDGYAFCRACKKHKQWKNIPFVFYTATYTTKEDEEFALSLGAARFILKPQEPKVFIHLIAEVLHDWKKGLLPESNEEFTEETEYLKLYNERLVRKLDDKLSQLERANAVQEQELQMRIKAEKRSGFLLEAIEQAGEAVLITDAKHEIIYVNQAFNTITGLANDDVVGKNPKMLMKAMPKTSALENGLWKMLSAEDDQSGTIMDQRQDGTDYTALFTLSSVKDVQQRTSHYVAIVQDVTELKRMEKQFHEAQKMEAVGILAGGIAHDFNNMLAAITMNIFLLKRSLNEPVKDEARYDLIERACGRAKDVVRHMLTFARKDEPIMGAIDLVEVIRDTLLLVRSSIPSNIMLHVDLPNKPIIVYGCASQVEQMLFNLLHNARDSLEGRNNAQLFLRLSCLDLEGGNGVRALISVRDNGSGIDADIISHVFEPFYTTKEVGKGTGLGLAMVYGAMKNHQGTAVVQSDEYNTTFTLEFPVAQLIAESETPGAEIELNGMNQRILLADDNLELRESLAEIFTGLGFEVTEAVDGRSALNCYMETPEAFSLAIFDVVMPVLNGVSVAKEIRATGSMLPIIFSTGYDSESVVPVNSKELEPFAVLNKPFTIQDCTRTVSRLLNLKLNADKNISHFHSHTNC